VSGLHGLTAEEIRALDPDELSRRLRCPPSSTTAVQKLIRRMDSLMFTGREPPEVRDPDDGTTAPLNYFPFGGR
jgi:hypothetical protein